MQASIFYVIMLFEVQLRSRFLKEDACLKTEKTLDHALE
jgi:hypothetical protein